MVKLVWRGATWLLVTCLALVAGLPGGPPVAMAARSPADCMVAEVALGMTRSLSAANLGDTVTFRTRISNTAPGNCDLASMSITMTTPDGVAHNVASDLSVPAGTATPWYDVSYVIAAADVKNNRVTAVANAEGLSLSNDTTDEPASGSTSLSVSVTPTVGILSICTEGSGAASAAQLRISGSSTNVPAGTAVTVTAAGSGSASASTGADGTWTAALPWNGASGNANVTAAVVYGTNNTGSASATMAIPAVQLNGGDAVVSSSKQPTLSGTATGASVTLTMAGTTTTAPVAGGVWSLTWPTTLSYGDHSVSASLDGACATDTQVLTVRNTEPAATDDAYTTAEDTMLSVAAPGVLANDIDLNNDPITAVLVLAPVHGDLTLNPDGSFVYIPTANYHGTDSFKYKANDGLADSYQATVTITITPVNDQPVAVNDAYTTAEDTHLVVGPAAGVLANDTDGDGDPLAASHVSGPSHGQLTLNSDGSFSYHPATNFTGIDTFRYQVGDGVDESNVATVTITVGDANDPPTSEMKEYNTDEDVPLVVAAPGLLAQATDPDGDTLVAVKVSDPAHGMVAVNPDGSFTYTPAANYFGLDQFVFLVNDGQVNSNESTVQITVNPINDAPAAVGDAYSVSEDDVLSIAKDGVLANDSDVDGGLGSGKTFRSVKVTDPAHGTVTLNEDGSLVYTPAANFNGTDSFTYKANDGDLDSNIATVTITVTPANDQSVAAPDTYSMNQNSVLTVPTRGVLINDSDLDGDSLTAVMKTPPAQGSLALNPDGSFTYTPPAGFVGTDTFTYAANDGVVESAPVTVTIRVNRRDDPPPPPSNRSPFANHDSYAVDEDGTLTVAARGVMLNDSDPDGDFLTAQFFSGPAHGVLALQSSGAFVYTPSPLFHGTDSFKYRVSDGEDVSNVATVTITVRHINHPPMANNDVYSVNQGAALTVQAKGVLGNDSDVDMDPLTAVLVTGPTHGTLTLNAEGSFIYTPAAGYHGPDSFTYQAFDGAAKSNLATAAISVQPGTPPVLVKPTISGVVIDAASGQVVTGASVAVSADFDANGTADFTAEAKTGADGRYAIEVPRGEWAYTAIVSAPVQTAVGMVTVVAPHTTVVPKTEKGGLFAAERKIAGQVYLQAGPGQQAAKPEELLAKGAKITSALMGQNGTVGMVQVDEKGLFTATGMASGSYKVVVKVTAPDGVGLAGTSIGAAVSGDGELVLGAVLIDPAGRVVDAVTKLPVDDVTVKLYWADTELNRHHGRTPDTLVALPMVPAFLPGQNAMPALSADGGTFAWLVHPDGDYYIVAEKPGYQTYDSRVEGRNTLPSGDGTSVTGGVVHVGAGLLKYNFAMEPVHARFIRGYPDGTFRPEQSITRAEVAAIMARIIQPTKVELPAPPFSDVPASHWAATYIELVRQKGLMLGDPSGTFRPDQPITRAELASILARYRSLTLDAPNPFTDTVGHWAEAAVSAAYRIGLITGYPDGTFHPQALTNRAEAATMINRMLGRGPLEGRSAPTWPDVPFSHWASGQVEEASSSHSAVRGDAAVERWTGDTGVETW